MTLKTGHKVGLAGASAACLLACAQFTPIWEGMDVVAKVDTIGTGHPITYCYGQTDEFGKVKVGQRFTKQQCNDMLAKSLPAYLAKIEPCIHVTLPAKTEAALLDAAYNAGPHAVCHSPMLAKMNAGDLKGGCEAFKGWYIRASGKVVKGLINRRNGDTRKGEKELCLEGLSDATKPVTPVTPVTPAKKWWQFWKWWQ